MKKLTRVALIITLLAVSFTLARSSAAATTSDKGWLHGAAGYARAVELQKQLNIPLVVYFYADWCSYCRTLDSQYLPSAPVQDYLDRVIKVRINPEKGVAERALAKRYGVSGYPSFFVISDSSARPVNVHPFRKVGNLSPTQLAKAYRAIAPVSQKVAAVKGPGTSGKFRVRASELVTKTTTTGRGSQIVTVGSTTPAAPVRVPSRKAQP